MQTKLQSLWESIVRTVISMVVGFATANYLWYPLFGIAIPPAAVGWLVVIFVAQSTILSYFIRRHYNGKHVIKDYRD
jgi:hypothetical protein